MTLPSSQNVANGSFSLNNAHQPFILVHLLGVMDAIGIVEIGSSIILVTLNSYSGENKNKQLQSERHLHHHLLETAREN